MQMGVICCLMHEQKVAATNEVISTAQRSAELLSAESFLHCNFIGAPVVVAVNSSQALRSRRS